MTANLPAPAAQSGGATKPQKTLVQKAKEWFNGSGHLMIFLFAAFVIGLAFPAPGEKLSEPTIDFGELGSMRTVQFVNVVLIFLISGFRLNTAAVVESVQKPGALLYSCLLILFVTPCVGFVAVRLPLGEMAVGLALFCCVPTTLTSGAALVSNCNGAKQAKELALLVTTGTNLAGCFTTPVLLGLVLGNSGGASVNINVGLLLVKLVVSLLIPTLIGKAAQALIPGAAKFSKDWKTPLTIFSNFNLVFVVWQSVSRNQSVITSQPADKIVACIASGILLHIVFWIINAFVFMDFVPGFTHLHQRRAVFLLASQKTLPVSLAIISGLDENQFPYAGLIALPCIFGHLSQLVIDGFLVDFWARHPDGMQDVKEAKSSACDERTADGTQVETKSDDVDASAICGSKETQQDAPPQLQAV